MTTNGIVLGRFQPLHLGHMEYLDAARALCHTLFIGITNSDRRYPLVTATDIQRSALRNNPFSYDQRQAMIELTLFDAGWSPSEFKVVRAPLALPDLLAAELPASETSTVFVTIYDDWGHEKAEKLKEIGYRVEILWERPYETRLTSGSEIRSRMRRGERWAYLVPRAVKNSIAPIDVDRLKCL